MQRRDAGKIEVSLIDLEIGGNGRMKRIGI